jgi:hypothetical protein
MTTNITQAHRDAFEALRDGAVSNFALLSCFVNGEPTAAIVAVNSDGADYALTPLFVSVTDAMHLTDHEGCTPDCRTNTLSVNEENGIEESHTAIEKAKGR